MRSTNEVIKALHQHRLLVPVVPVICVPWFGPRPTKSAMHKEPFRKSTRKMGKDLMESVIGCYFERGKRMDSARTKGRSKKLLPPSR